MSSAAHESAATPIELPDLGVGDAPVRLVQWLVEAGAEVIEGERVAEVLADGVLFHVEAPASGTLIEINTSAGRMIGDSARIGVIGPVDQRRS